MRKPHPPPPRARSFDPQQQQGGASTSGGGGGGDPLLALRRLMTFSRRFARNLRVTRLPSRLDPQIIFDAMVK